jgi:hypothetical protein
MKILTSVRNWIGQLDKSYIIAKGAWVVPTVDDHDHWCDSQWPTFWSIISISTQYDLVNASAATIIY